MSNSLDPDQAPGLGPNCLQNSSTDDKICRYEGQSKITEPYVITFELKSVTCLATDACLTADPGVGSSIPARYHTFVEIDHEIISTVILLPSADLFKKGCCQLQAKVCAQITG